MHLHECQTFALEPNTPNQILWKRPTRGMAIIQNAGSAPLMLGTAADVISQQALQLNPGEMMHFTEANPLFATSDEQAQVTVMELDGQISDKHGALGHGLVEVGDRIVEVVGENAHRIGLEIVNNGPESVTIGGPKVKLGSNGLTMLPGSTLKLECTSALYAIGKITMREVPSMDPDEPAHQVREVNLLALTEESF